ncbi:MAG: hypothetical protein AAGH74_10975 [Pseudomonadota bacterium]
MRSETGEGNVAKLRKLLTPEETTELARIQRDPLVVGYMMLTHDGEEIEVSGDWRETGAPIFANAFDLVDRVGSEFGEDTACPIFQIEGPVYDVTGFMLSATRIVIVSRKQKGITRELRSVG